MGIAEVEVGRLGHREELELILVEPGKINMVKSLVWESKAEATASTSR